MCRWLRKGRKVGIITGFYFPDSDPPATETDGPPGALILAEGLKCMGMEVILISDPYTLSALRAGLKILRLPERDVPILSFPMEHFDEKHVSRKNNEGKNQTRSIDFVEEFFNGPLGRNLTHMISIERVGPNHTLESVHSQNPSDPDLLKEFEKILPLSMRNRCYNSRIEDITPFTGKTHLLIEMQRKWKLPIETIGVADRGNEIGAGRVPWKIFREVSEDREAIFCSRIQTDYLITCGISNWGGYGLLAGTGPGKEKARYSRKSHS